MQTLKDGLCCQLSDTVHSQVLLISLNVDVGCYAAHVEMLRCMKILLLNINSDF